MAKIDTSIEIKKQYRRYIIGALARHFGVTRDSLFADVDIEADTIMQFESLRDHGFKEVIFSSHTPKTAHSDFFYGKNFQKSDAYTAFLEAEVLVDPRWRNLFVMNLHNVVNGKATHYMIYRDSKNRGYEGLGGIYLTLPDGERFVIEPVENFLEYYYPSE